jgi:isochorismate hydrolase
MMTQLTLDPARTALVVIDMTRGVLNALSEEEHYYVCTRIFPRMGRLRSTDEIVAALRATEHVSSNDST